MVSRGDPSRCRGATLTVTHSFAPFFVSLKEARNFATERKENKALRSARNRYKPKLSTKENTAP